MASAGSGQPEPGAATAAELPRATIIGTLRVLYVEADEVQQKALLALFESANEQNAGAVSFAVTRASRAAAMRSDPTAR